MKEMEAREAGEAGIEGDEAAATGDSESGKVGIRPHWVGKF